MTDRRGLRRGLAVGGLVLVAAGAAVMGLAAPARADGLPGSGLGAFSVVSTSPGVQFTYDNPGASAHPQAEGEVPETVAQLQSGPQGYALSSVAWPGALVANAGTTSQLLNLPVPASAASSLNEPIRAEARTGSGDQTVTNNSYPGSVMTATAGDDHVSADATVGTSSGPLPQSGSGDTESRSTVDVTGPSSVAGTAYSIAKDVVLDGGVVRITSVTSHASVTSFVTGSTGTASTEVTGLTIAGQPAYLDESGLHLGQSGPGAPVNTIANAIAQQAVTSAGMKVAVSQPTINRQGPTVSVDAGNVVFYFAPPNDSNGDTFTATFGGASITASTSSSFGSAGQILDVPPAAFGSGSGSSSPVPVATADASTGAVAASPAASGPAASASAAPVAPTMADRGTPSTSAGSLGATRLSSTLALPHGISPFGPVLVGLGSLLLAGALRRLPDRLLEESSAHCIIGESK
ncbi:MAG TPA: hypothetical protein VFH58_10515 [Acidimicrobiales bacterium]|nr:hypothetical protein [Acidimicrobiales bacterium]